MSGGPVAGRARLTGSGRRSRVGDLDRACAGTMFRDIEPLITGANGFVGKVVLAMLLDRFPDVRRVHVLIRPRREQGAAERFRSDVLDSPALEPLVRKCGRDAVESRVHVLSGDAAEPLAGIAEREVRSIAGRVGVVINCAGLVDFFPPLDASIRANVDSVLRVAELCKLIDARLVHISTCYVAGEDDGLVEETEPVEGYYPRRGGTGDRSFRALAELENCRRLAEPAARGLEGPERAESLAELGRRRAARWGWVNTYTYTKALGEQVLATRAEVRHAIVRPAIVESALAYPFPGWIEGGRTAAPLALMALGGLLDWPARPELSLEVVPVDYVAAAALTVARKLLEGDSRPVYQLATSDVNPYPLGDLIRLLHSQSRGNGGRAGGPPAWLVPLPRLRFLAPADAERRRARLRRRISRVRWLLRRAGRHAAAARLRPLELQLGFHAETFRQYLPFIHDHQYVFETVNIRQAYAGADQDWRAALPWEPESIDWPDYWLSCQIPGFRRWIQPEAVRQWSFRL